MFVNSNAQLERMHFLLKEIWSTHEDETEQWDKNYVPNMNELIGYLSQNVNVTIAFLDSLDFEDKADQYIRWLLPRLESSFSAGEQFLLVQHIDKLQEKYPDVDFAAPFVWHGYWG